MEKKYCIYCGTEHSVSETVCRKCSKKLDPEENLLKDYLISKTKDKLKGDAEDKLFDVLKNFLLSHLYGVVVTISVVFVAASGLSGLNMPVVYENPVDEEMNVHDEQHNPVTDEEQMLQDFIQEYFFVYDSDFDLNPDLRTAGLKYQLPEAYGYDGVFEMFDVKYTEDTTIMHSGSFSRVTADPKVPSTELGKKLVQDGYRIAEGTVEKAEERYHDNGDAEILAETHYHITLAYVDSKWYVAEAIITYESGEWIR